MIGYMNKIKLTLISCIIAFLFVFSPNFNTIARNSSSYKLLSSGPVTSCTESMTSCNVKTGYKLCCAEITNDLPQSFRYRDINEAGLKAYLASKSSILREDPYFSSILNVGKSFDINPILLFAITGQEQGFVPEQDVSASIIANNPYNVFCSWQSYNTNIIDSSEIACRTIINLSKNRPVSVDPLVWINQKYSADQNWHCGVKHLYREIELFIQKYEENS